MAVSLLVIVGNCSINVMVIIHEGFKHLINRRLNTLCDVLVDSLTVLPKRGRDFRVVTCILRD